MINRYNAEQKEQMYKIYVTDTLKVICENIANSSGGSVINQRYYDMINKGDNKPQRTSEDIISSVIENINNIRGEDNDERI